MPKQLIKIEESLNKLHLDFNKQLEILGNNPKEFHNALIDLSSKYPDHKELLQFIVFVNDKLETNQTIFFDIVVDSFNDMLKVKKELIQELINKESNKDISIETIPKTSFINKLGSINFKDIKIILITIVTGLLLLTAIFVPEALITISTTIQGLMK